MTMRPFFGFSENEDDDDYYYLLLLLIYFSIIDEYYFANLFCKTSDNDFDNQSATTKMKYNNS